MYLCKVLQALMHFPSLLFGMNIVGFYYRCFWLFFYFFSLFYLFEIHIWFVISNHENPWLANYELEAHPNILCKFNVCEEWRANTMRKSHRNSWYHEENAFNIFIHPIRGIYWCSFRSLKYKNECWFCARWLRLNWIWM